jgi:hypothetical protein
LTGCEALACENRFPRTKTQKAAQKAKYKLFALLNE